MNNDNVKLVRDYLIYLLQFKSFDDLPIDDVINVGLFLGVCNKLLKK